jgi:hypothetical protein
MPATDTACTLDPRNSALEIWPRLEISEDKKELHGGPRAENGRLNGACLHKALGSQGKPPKGGLACGILCLWEEIKLYIEISRGLQEAVRIRNRDKEI